MSAAGNARRKQNHRDHVAAVPRDELGRPLDRRYRSKPPRALREDESLSRTGYRVLGRFDVEERIGGGEIEQE
jgi:hypothetical protein